MRISDWSSDVCSSDLITDCDAPAAAPGTTACTRDTEGASNAIYGGADDADSSGRLSYVQIRYSGFVLSNGKELQGLTPSGVGTGTQIDHIQVHNSSDRKSTRLNSSH